ncbi:MAG: hypothetical protein Q8P11_01860, partial [bacterium]|nr:hypothetical protein [bacterium]
ISEVAGDPPAGRLTFRISAVRRCREATRRAAGTATRSAKERSDFAELSYMRNHFTYYTVCCIICE